MVTTIDVNKAPTAQADQTFQSQTSFLQRLVDITVMLGSNPTSNPQPATFAGTGSNQITLSGHRTRCRIANAGAPSASTADVTIFGMDQSIMNQLATLGILVNQVSQNTILVSAGSAQNNQASAGNASISTAPSGFPVVFGGTIWFSFGDYNQQPEVPFRISAQGALLAAVQSAKPASFTGATSVATFMQGIASQLGIGFENNGVTAQLSNPYFPGTLLQQMYQAAEHAFIHAQIVDGGTKLAIWPLNSSRSSLANIPLIAEGAGMIGYPSFAFGGFMIVKSVFNPNVSFGGNIQVQSTIPQANGTWTVRKMEFALDSLTPGGEWAMTMHCVPKGALAPAVSPL